MTALPDVPLTDAEHTAAFERSLFILAGTSGSRTGDRARVLINYARHLQAPGADEAGRRLFDEALAI